MKEVILHVGHGKTGSSYLQSLLALNVSFLNQKGIAYPFHRSFEGAASGFISSGNGKILSVENIEAHDYPKVLFSGEQLFSTLLNSDLLSILAYGHKLRVILYTRDVVEHALSRWAQGVKRGGLKSDVDSYLLSKPIGPYPLVADWIDKSKSLGFDLVIKNYTKNKKNITSRFMLDAFNGEVESSELVLPVSERVNRSLTNSEYEVQRVFNAAFGKKTSKYLSDFLVNKFPNSPAHPIKISKKTYFRLVEKNAEYVEKVNDYLRPEEHISYGSEHDFVGGNEYGNFSTDVVEALGESIKENFSRITFHDEDAELLRNTALKIHSGKILNLSDALALMKIASRNRPDGPLINGMVRDWTEQLKSNKNERAVLSH